ncbi:major facilitator superfamily domain-containing protein [Dendryphion nanum]|uniref:Major facilitator superfamily domain-containing protein n=1 Tax=Dendryphion nanum TaxID=256645 RepID=A0A9P9E8W5_9PLEO|nr:major facilitator superfamily domain-containing protein [Dendryphion nanum]
MSDLNTKETLRPISMADSEKTAAQSVNPSVLDTKELGGSNIPSNAASMRENSVEPQGLDEKKNAAEITAERNSDRGSTAEAVAEEDDDFEYPKAWKLAAITIALCLSVFCMALDNTIIATAIPRITDQFKTLNDVGWYGSSYLLTTCATQLIYGKFYTFYSIKWVYLSALFIFEVGSLICGVSPNSTALILGRAIAGVGAAGIFSGAILIIANTVPLRQRPTYMGLVGGMYGIASVAGPLMGGAFTDHLTWRWCFYINLPFGAVTAAFIIPFLSVKRRGGKTNATWKEQVSKFDLQGTAVFLPAIVCLLLALQWGGSKYEWKSGRIIALLVLFVVLIIAFIAIQIWKQELATVPPRVFKNRNVWGSAWFGAMLGACFFVLVYFLPIWFQAIKGASATKSGIMNLPMILGLVVISMGAGGAVTALGYYTPFMLVSAVLMAIGAGLLSTFTTETNSPKWIGYQFLFGAGVGFGMQQTLVAVQTALPDDDIPIATSLMMFAQTLGGALFISVAQNVFTNSLITNLKAVVPDLDPKIVLITGATELKSVIEPKYLGGVLVAYNKTLQQTFYVSVATASLSIFGAAFVQWKSMKGKNIQMAAA